MCAMTMRVICDLMGYIINSLDEHLDLVLFAYSIYHELYAVINRNYCNLINYIIT